MSVVPSKKVIQDSFLGASTRRAYSTYQRQFEAYCVEKKDGLSPVTATANDCTEFFHHLYSLGRKARTVDGAKTALVSYFNQHNVQPNPAQDILAKRYVIGLQKYNRLNNIDDEKKAHPLTVHELSMIMNLFAEHNPFVASMVQFLLSSCFLGCFRISEVLALKWTDVAMGVDEHGKYISIRLRWHKKASVEKECQIYHLIDESLYPCLRICALYDGYLDRIRSTHMNVSKDSYVFPSYTLLQCGAVKLDWFKPLDQNFLRRLVQGLVESPPTLPIGISLHSMRRGGCFYRVFDSTERKFNFRELMAWCRWEDAKTCAEYLVTKSISDKIDPRNLLRMKTPSNGSVLNQVAGVDNWELLLDEIRKCIRDEMNVRLCKKIESPRRHQSSIKDYVVPKGIPTARNAGEAWSQWFTADQKMGLLCAIKDFSREMIKRDRKRYSERHTLGLAFAIYTDLEQFEAAYAGHTSSYSSLLREVRKRKRENRL